MSQSPAPAAPEPPPVYRWVVLLACSLGMFGNYYVFDAVSPVTPFLQQTFGFTGAQIGLLDTAYNVAALLTLIAGGILIDRIGVAASSLLFGAIGAAGSVLIAVLPAVIPGAPWAGMMVGRFVLGIGAELYIVAVTTVVGRWFKGKEISFALALQVLLARLGSWAADKSPDFFKGLFTSWQPPLLLASGLGVAWLGFALLYAALERRAARVYAVKHAGATDKLVWGDLVRFDLSYWWLVGLCVAFYATIFPFRSFSNLYFVEGRGMAADAAGSLKSVIPLLAMFGMPLFGLLADRIGRRSLLMAVGAALLVPPFFLLPFTNVPPVVSMGMLGVAFALVPAVIWPCVTYLAPESRLGSAYALMTFCQNLGWAAMSWGVGAVKDAAHASAANPGGWTPVLLTLGALASLSLVFAFLVLQRERGPHGHGLELVKPPAHGEPA